MNVDLSGPLKVDLDKTLAEARTLEAQGKTMEAAAAYLKAAKLMRSYAEYALTRDDQVRRNQKARQYMETADALKAGKRHAASPAPVQKPSTPVKEQGPTED